MKSNFKNDKYWIAFGITTIILLFLIYPSTPFQSVSLNLTRSDAIKIAQKFIESKDIDISDYMVEGFVAENMVTNTFLMKKLGNEGYAELSNNTDWNLYGWTIFFHKNIEGDKPQTTYLIRISNHGIITGYEREIPDTTSISSLSKPEAEELMKKTIGKNLPVDFSQFTMTESREDNYANRTDFSFKWTREPNIVKGELVIDGKIQGNEPGEYRLSYLVPEEERAFFNTGEALFGTMSVIFVGFLMVFSLYFFLKKYHQGEIWINVGRSLFIIYFVAALITVINVWPNLGLGVNIGNLSFMSVKIIVALINGLLVQFLLALLVFASWAVGESYGREYWPDKLKGTDSIVRGHLFTLSSGSSLLRGTVIGISFAFIYALASILLNKPGADFFINPVANFDIYHGYVPFFSAIGDAFIFATLGGITVVFFVINLSYSKWRRKWLSILIVGIVTVLARVIAITPPSVNDFSMNIITSFIFGGLIGYLYFKFDLLTILSALFFSLLTYQTFTIFSASPDYYIFNTLLILAVFTAIPVIYIISRIRKKEFELEDYGMPSHIEKISERERLKKELEIAAKVQLSLLPKEHPHLPGYDIASLSLPAKEAGGDYYDFVKLSNNKIGIAVGDVSGKGVGAAIYMTLTKGILQAHAEENVSPRVVLGKVNRLLYKTIEKNSFVSMFYAILDVENHSLLYSRAGHNPGILCSFEGGNSKMLMSKGIALGLEEGKVFQETLVEDTIKLEKGDVVVLYTDGFTEAMNSALEQFGEKNFVDLIEKNRNKSSNKLLNLILKSVHSFTKDYPQHDDMTIVILKRE